MVLAHLKKRLTICASKAGLRNCRLLTWNARIGCGTGRCAWTFNADGSSSGTIVLTGSNKVARDGNSFKGPFDFKVFDVDGNLIGEATGTTIAERLSVQ
ncbi:MAG TPA: hypothetical protein VHU23_05115 [Rhizomicrobium sp.]|nr:hypothetical protein [Rhizomicrobium sp.]